MKKLLFFALLLLISQLSNTYSQVITKSFNLNEVFAAYPKLNRSLTGVPSVRMPNFNLDSLINEDLKFQQKDVPFRFGKGFDVNYTLKDGSWVDSDSVRIWSLKISSHGAYSLNFIFKDFYLPNKAELYIYNTNGTVLYGPVTSAQNTPNGFFMTDLIQGDESIIQIFEPNEVKNQTKLNISRVVHAYKNMIYSDASLLLSGLAT